MASAREFCREVGYPVAIIFTYSFDPLFFERIPLADFSIGGSRRILIAADAIQASEAISNAIGQIAHLGRRYILAETAGANLFHPKLIARLSDTGGRVWLGSGNTTSGGWGGNQELATSWSIGPEQQDKGSWLDEILEAVSTLVRSSTFTDQLGEIRHVIPWLSARPPLIEPPPVLLGMPDKPLAPQLAARWLNRRFTELKICTGSTDESGAFLSWAHRTFGIERATICLSPAFASFRSQEIGKATLGYTNYRGQS